MIATLTKAGRVRRLSKHCSSERCRRIHIRATVETPNGGALGVFHRLSDARSFLARYRSPDKRIELLAGMDNHVICEAPVWGGLWGGK